MERIDLPVDVHKLAVAGKHLVIGGLANPESQKAHVHPNVC